MKAVQIVAPYEMQVVDMEQPKPQAGEVLVKMCFVG